MAATKQFDRIISADSHVMEPLDTWWNAIGHKYGDRTPRVIDEHRGKKGRFFYTGYLGATATDLLLFEGTPETKATVFEATERGFGACGYDPEVRVKFQDEAGVSAEVMTSTNMLFVLRNPDHEVVQASSEVFNDWEVDFCSYNPKRLIGVSIIPMYDVDWAVKELERTTKKGLMSPMINCQAPEGRPPYRDRSYDKFWAAAQDLGVPVTLHLLTGRALDPLTYAETNTPEENTENPSQWVSLFNEIQEVLAGDFIFGGILDRFPNLKIVNSEFEMSWVPSFVTRLDQLEYNAIRLHLPKLEMRPREYMKTRIWHGLIYEDHAQDIIPLIGADRVMWGSDFPHGLSIGLHAQDVLAKLFEGLPLEDQDKVVGGNVAKVFNIN